jgi:hypothetical protein
VNDYVAVWYEEPEILRGLSLSFEGRIPLKLKYCICKGKNNHFYFMMEI